MTQDEIKKALDICTDIYAPCNGCPYEMCTNCDNTLHTDALNVIIEQEREIERLKAEVKQAKIDVLNKAKEKLDSAPNGWAYTTYIDELIKEVQNGKDKG